MPGRHLSHYSLLACLALLLTACLPADEISLRQSVREWPEQRLVFIADSRLGRVQSFHLGGGAPVPFALTHGNQRASVSDLQLDAQRGQLWVLGDDGVSVYDARRLVLQKRVLFDTQNISALRIEAGRIVLIAKSGEQVGQIDSTTLAASGRLLGRRS